MNNVVLVGRLTKDPELRYIPGTGTAVASSSIAIDRDFTKKDGSKETDFIPFEIMGKPAEFVANYVPKGTLVAIQGSIRVDQYQTQSGEKRTFTKVSARNLQKLEGSKGNNQGQQQQQNNDFGTFEPAGLDPQGFQAIDSYDVPF
nr:MAG TPA: Single strand binding protein [Caudoviricetes sp.]